MAQLAGVARPDLVVLAAQDVLTALTEVNRALGTRPPGAATATAAWLLLGRAQHELGVTRRQLHRHLTEVT